MLLSVEHITAYRYSEPVRLGPHRLMVRPMEGHDVQVRSSALVIEPSPRIRWLHDAFDNSIAIVEFARPTAALRIESRVTVEQFNTNPFDFVLEPHAVELPFQYQDEEAPDLAPYLLQQHPEDEAAVRNWIRPFLNVKGRAKTFEFLLALNRAAQMFFTYTRREEPGVQSPAETLRKRAGSCRDFALLFIETARSLGLAARYASGYLCQSEPGQYGAASGATHAWAEVYLPGAGWKGFDPTCGTLAADMHVRVGVVRKPSQAVPVSGAFVGPPTAYLGMDVTVNAKGMEGAPVPDQPG